MLASLCAPRGNDPVVTSSFRGTAAHLTSATGRASSVPRFTRNMTPAVRFPRTVHWHRTSVRTYARALRLLRFVLPEGIEPPLQPPQGRVLSIKLWEQRKMRRYVAHHYTRELSFVLEAEPLHKAVGQGLYVVVLTQEIRQETMHFIRVDVHKRNDKFGSKELF